MQVCFTKYGGVYKYTMKNMYENIGKYNRKMLASKTFISFIYFGEMRMLVHDSYLLFTHFSLISDISIFLWFWSKIKRKRWPEDEEYGSRRSQMLFEIGVLKFS